MTSLTNRNICCGLALAAMTALPGAGIPVATAQTDAASATVTVAPLFEYPVPPEEMESLAERSEWILTHFWEPMDLKSKTTVDQNALNHAFGVYAMAMQWAPRDAVNASTAALIKKLSKNPTLMIQFTKAAEEKLYGPRADIWIDEVYIDFLKGAAASKKLDSGRRERYTVRMEQLSRTLRGSYPPRFTFTRPDGTEAEYFPMSTPTVIEFGDPACMDCRMARMRMETNVAFSRLVSQGKINVMFITPDEWSSQWAGETAGYPSGWVVGASEMADDLYDIRREPCFYVIDSQGHIVDKNLDVDSAIAAALELVM